jgi:uncharacterized phage protein (TIGR02216 family)
LSAAGGDAAPVPFPWEEAMALGLNRLRLTPDLFWSLTPRELLLIANGLASGSALGRADMEALVARYG